MACPRLGTLRVAPFAVLMLAAISAHQPRASPRAVRMRLHVRMQGTYEPDEPSTKLRRVKGLLRSALHAGGAVASTVKSNTDNWLNSGWSVKKRVGQWLPDIRPNSEDLAIRLAASLDVAVMDANGSARTPPMRDAIDVVPYAAALAVAEQPNIEVALKSSLAIASPADLSQDFLAFLAEREAASAAAGGGATMTIGEDGTITFASKRELGQFVGEFSYGKLRQISAAARALARYVEDLEAELESADVTVVRLRAQMREAARAAAERETAVAGLQRRADEVEGRLGATSAELDASELALEAAEARADAAASDLSRLHESLERAEAQGEQAQAQREEVRRVGVRLEEQLLDAERRALANERAKRQLASELEQLELARADAAHRAHAASELAELLSSRVLTAEATAERKAAQLDELLSKQERDSNVLNDAVRTLELRFNSLKSDSTAASSAAAGSMETEARQLCAELRDVLDENHLALIDDGIEPASAQATRPLSRMRKAELVAECAALGLETHGTVAELRARVRTERKRQSGSTAVPATSAGQSELAAAAVLADADGLGR